jgi:hypothetical protein
VTTTVRLEPTKMYPDRQATMVRTDRGELVEAAVEVRQQHPPPDGRTVVRFAVYEDRLPGAPGDRHFVCRRPGFVEQELTVLPTDPREYPMCSCRKFVENAWCLHVEALRAFQTSLALDPLET